MATYDVPIASETTSQEIKTDVTAIKSTTTNTKAGVDMLLNAVQGTTATDPTATRSHMVTLDFRNALPMAGQRAYIELTCEIVADTGTVLASANISISGGAVEDDDLTNTVLYNAPYSVRAGVVNIYLTRYGSNGNDLERYVNFKDSDGNCRILLSTYHIDLTKTAAYVDVTRLITRRADAEAYNTRAQMTQKMFDFRECDETIYRLLIDLYKADMIDIRDYWHIGDTRYYTIGGRCNPIGDASSANKDSVAFVLMDYKLPSNITRVDKTPKNQLLLGIYAYRNPGQGTYFKSKFGGTANSKASYYSSTLASNLHYNLNSLPLYHEWLYTNGIVIANDILMDYVAPARITMLSHNGTDWCAYVGKANSSNRFYIPPTLPNVVGKTGMELIDRYGGEQIEYFRHGLVLIILEQSATDIHTQSPVTDANGAHYAVTLSSNNPSKMYDALSDTAYKTMMYDTELQTLVLAVAN